MRPISVALALVVPLALAGCSTGTEEEPGAESAEPAADQSQEEPEERPYGAGEQITVDLVLLSAEEGGRVAPFFSGYRGAMDFGGEGPRVDCTVRLPADVDEFVPGDSHLVVLECVEDVVVHVSETGVALVEDGDEIGHGDVVFTEE